MIVPDSIMPRFIWFFKKDVSGRYVLNDDGKAIIAFIQHRSALRGRWRDEFIYQTFLQGSSSIQSNISIENGKLVYLRRCAGCHGKNGDGRGKASDFFSVKPRDFTSGTYKFRSTPSGSLPLDGDIYRTVSAGIRGTSMPAWYVLSEHERWDVINYIKSFYSGFNTIPPEQPVFIPPPPSPTAELVREGRRIFDELKCWECHGREGRGDGEKAATLRDEWGDPIMPTDFTKGIFKSGSRPEDLYRTIMTGLNGTPMPSYIDSIQVLNVDPWALVYYVLSLSAEIP